MKVPEYTKQVSDGGPERVRRSPLDSGSAMSAVAAEGRGAQGVAGALGDLSGVFGKIAADADEAKIMAAANDYMAKSTSLLYDSEKGLLNAQGAGAEGLSERSAMAHKSFADDIASKLTARQRKHFYETVANYDRSAGRSVMAHESKALSDYRAGEAKKLLANTAVTFSKNPDGLSMEAQEDLIRSITLGMFGDQGEEGNIKNSDLIRSALIQQTIANIAVNDPTAAEKFFEKHQSLMEASIAEEVKNTLVKAALPVKAQKLYTEVGGDFNKGIAYIEKNISAGEQKAYRAEFENYYADMQKVKNERYKQASSEIAKIYLSGGSLSGGELQKLTDAGIISPEIAITWSNAFDNRVEKQLNIIYRNEVRAERAEQKRFRERLKKAPPTEKAFLLLEYNYGVTKADAQKNYERDRKKMEMQNLSESDILDAVGLGEYTEPQGRLLLSGLKKQDTLYNKAASRERQAITDIFKSIPAISESDKNAALMSFDEQAFRENVKKEELPFLRNSVVSEILGKKDYASARLNPFDSDAEKMLKKIKEQGTLESKRKKNNKSSIDDILGSLGDNP